MHHAVIEPRPMAKAGRPPKPDKPMTTNVRISKEVNDLARKAGVFTGEGIAAYVERVVRAQATADLDRHTKNWQESEAKKGKGGEA